MGAIDRAAGFGRAATWIALLELPPGARGAARGAARRQIPRSPPTSRRCSTSTAALTAEGFLDIGAARPAARAAPLAGMTIGAYTLVSPIGHGGMGSVWLAERSDGRFEGQAALKLLNAALVGRGGEERFKREGTILARLTHPHIARLIDAGVSATGQPYLVLEHVDGRHIDRYCDERAPRRRGAHPSVPRRARRRSRTRTPT